MGYDDFISKLKETRREAEAFSTKFARPLMACIGFSMIGLGIGMADIQKMHDPADVVAVYDRRLGPMYMPKVDVNGHTVKFRVDEKCSFNFQGMRMHPVQYVGEENQSFLFLADGDKQMRYSFGGADDQEFIAEALDNMSQDGMIAIGKKEDGQAALYTMRDSGSGTYELQKVRIGGQDVVMDETPVAPGQRMEG